MKIIILEKNSVSHENDISFDELKALGDVQIYDMLPKDNLTDIIKDADAIICNKAKITKEVMDSCPKLKYVGLWATGYDNVSFNKT